MHPPDTRRKVVVFCDRYYNPSKIELVEAIADAFPRWELTVIQEVPPRRRWPRFRGMLRRWAREPVSYPIRAIGSLAGRIQRPRAGRSPVGLAGSLAEIDRPNVEYVRVDRLHREATLHLVEDLSPWLGISIGAPILKRSLFAIPEQGTINIHKSLLPAYRGMPPGFWELHDGAPVSGVSIHWVDDGLDTGGLVTQRPLTIAPYSTPKGLAAELDLLGIRVLLEALRRIDQGDVSSEPQGVPAGPANRRPPWPLERAVRRRAWRRRSGNHSSRRWIIDALKDLVLLSYVHCYAPLRNAVRRVGGRCHTTVLLYHRVNDEFLDTVTVGVEQFAQHLRCLRRQYDVVDLPTFLSSRGEPHRRPRVVLTFDDGYKDNLLAAMLLRRAGLPCTFFVSTRIVGTNRAFPHDQQRLGRQVPALNWDQVRQLTDWGFQVSNHTAHHANLSHLSFENAAEEIATAQCDLQQELGDRANVHWLAYPHGKPEDITNAVRNHLPELGIGYCFSAYGGTNPPDFDPMNILRQGIDCKFTTLRLRAAIEGWKWKS